MDAWTKYGLGFIVCEVGGTLVIWLVIDKWFQASLFNKDGISGKVDNDGKDRSLSLVHIQLWGVIHLFNIPKEKHVY